MVEGAQLVLASCATFTGRRTSPRAASRETEFGRTLTELVDRAAEVFPSVGTDPRGTLVSPMPEGGEHRGAWRAAWAALLVTLRWRPPRRGLSPQKAALAEKAVGEGIRSTCTS